jgi:hypothetical protein
MISLPASPPASANTVEKILGDNMAGGSYGQNWVVYAYDAASNGYGNALALGATMEKGKGYWVIQSFKEEGVRLDMPANSTETPATEPIPLAASKDGSVQWNLAGNPLATSLAMGDLRLTTNAPSCNDGSCGLDKARDNNLIHNKVWTYTGSSYEEKGIGDSLQPWDAFWIPALGASQGHALSLVTDNKGDVINIAIDKDESKNDYGSSGEEIKGLTNLETKGDAVGTGKISKNWDVDIYYFSIPKSGEITIELTAEKDSINIKAGSSPNSQNYFRSDENGTYHSNTFKVNAGEVVHLTIWDQDTNSAYTYNLKIGFTDGSSEGITSLSDYDFIGDGYGELTTPSTPAAGIQKPYVPDLSHIHKEDVLYVAAIEKENQGSGTSESSPANLESMLSRGAEIKGKTIVALNGTYPVQMSGMKNIENVRLIAKNKGEAKLVPKDKGSKTIFKFKDTDTNIHDFSIIGFESFNDKNIHEENHFIKNSGIATSNDVNNIYLSDMKWQHFHTVVYSGLHSHDWTIDKSIHYDSTYSYLWYMMGWHHSVINSVMYGNTYYSLAIRGSYPPSLEYYDEGGNDTIEWRMTNTNDDPLKGKHHLGEGQWTHLIANNTFGSNYNHFRTRHDPDNLNAWSHITISYNLYGLEEKDGKGEVCYYPPKNIAIINNVFIDDSTSYRDDVDHYGFDDGFDEGKGFNRYPLKIDASRGINTGKLNSVNNILFKGNYTDSNKNSSEGKVDIFISTDHDKLKNSDVEADNTLVRNTADFMFKKAAGERNIDRDIKYDYSIISESVLKDSGSTKYWRPNVDFKGNTRRGLPDVGAYEVGSHK